MTLTPDGPPHASPEGLSARAKGWLLALVLIAAAFTSFAGSDDRLPLDTHDVMVALTAQEMIARDQLLVPYINDAPRLKKPPMNYWMVMAAERLDGDSRLVSPWEARLPSAVAGVALVGLTVALGVVTLGWEAALLAGLMLACCRAFVSYSHSPRPEMVYAMFCTAAMLAFALSERLLREGGSRQRARWAAYAAWAAMGLAMMTKGPQLPLAIVAGLLLAMAASGERSRMRGVVRPGVGLLIFLAVAGPWYVMVFTGVGDAWQIWWGEISVRAKAGNDPWYRILYPYYLYMAAVLLLPWVALLPMMWGAPLLAAISGERRGMPAVVRPEAGRRGLMLLWWWVVGAAAILSLVRGRREYYLLPMLGPMMLLVAHGTLWLARALRAKSGAGPVCWEIFRTAMALGAGAVAVFLHRNGPEGHRPGTAAMIVCVAVSVLAAMLPWLRRDRLAGPRGAATGFGAAALAWVITMTLGAQAGALWGANRYERDAFARELKNAVPAGDPLLGWRDDWYIEAYRTGRVIPIVRTADQIVEQVEQHGEVYVLYRPRRRPIDLPKGYELQSVHRLEPQTDGDDDDADVLDLARVRRSRDVGLFRQD